MRLDKRIEKRILKEQANWKFGWGGWSLLIKTRNANYKFVSFGILEEGKLRIEVQVRDEDDEPLSRKNLEITPEFIESVKKIFKRELKKRKELVNQWKQKGFDNEWYRACYEAKVIEDAK